MYRRTIVSYCKEVNTMVKGKPWNEMTGKKKFNGIAGAVIILLLVVGLVSVLAGSKNSSNASVKSTSVSTTKPVTTPAPAPSTKAAPSPTPATPTASTSKPMHTVVYQFAVDSGTFSSADEQSVGLGWDDPATGKHKVPDDLIAALYQMKTSGYSVSFSVPTISTDKLLAGITNDSSHATISCTLLVDGQVKDAQQAPPHGYADCSGDPIHSDSGTNPSQ